MSSTTVDMGTGWDHAEPTEEKGVVRVRRKGEEYSGMTATSDLYVVHLEVQIEADSAEEAADQAMRFRDAIGMAEDTDAALERLDFSWHLHGPNGC